MQKVNGFAITRLTLTGFKCFEETESFDFGDRTFITAYGKLLLPGQGDLIR